MNRASVFLRHVLRWMLGLFFIVAAGAKLADVERFVETIGDFGLAYPPLIHATAWALIVLEIAAGFGLALGVRGALLLTTGLLVVFLAALGYGLWRGLDIDCGCLGLEFSLFGETDLKVAFWRDVALLICCGYLFVFDRRRGAAVQS